MRNRWTEEELHRGLGILIANGLSIEVGFDIFEVKGSKWHNLSCDDISLEKYLPWEISCPHSLIDLLSLRFQLGPRLRIHENHTTFCISSQAADRGEWAVAVGVAWARRCSRCTRGRCATTAWPTRGASSRRTPGTAGRRPAGLHCGWNSGPEW